MFLQKIDRYIFKNILNSVVFYTLVPTLILWIVQSRHIFELAIGGKVSIFMILKLSSYLIPPILPHIIPFSMILAIITVLVKLYNDSELAIMWTTGLSPARLMRSFLLIGFIGTIVILAINSFLAPKMSRQLKIELFNVKNDIIQNALKPGLVQSLQNGNLIIYIDKVKANSYIKGFYLQQKSDDKKIQIFTAKQALLTEKNGDFQLLLLKGRIAYWDYLKDKTAYQNNTKKQTSYPIILEFDKFTLNISDLLTNFNKNQDLQFKARDYSITELLYAKNAQTPQEKMRFIISGHEQIINSLLPIIFTLFAVLMMLRPMPPRGFPYGIILKTILMAVLFRIASSALQNSDVDGLNIIYVSYTIHLLAIIAMILLMITKRRSLK